MAVHKYKSNSAFDKGLWLDIVETIDTQKTCFKYTGFDSLTQAGEYCRWWSELHWGYFPHAYASEENGVITAYCERWNSCD